MMVEMIKHWSTVVPLTTRPFQNSLSSFNLWLDGAVEKKERMPPERLPKEVGILGLVPFWCKTQGSCARAKNLAFLGPTGAVPMCEWIKFC